MARRLESGHAHAPDATLDRLVDVARAQRQLAMDLFQAINSVPPCERADGACRAWDAVRRHVGMRLIRRYYADGCATAPFVP